jgi:Peptidase S46
MKNVVCIVLVLGAIGAARNTARGDEGLWLFNHPPTKLLQERYKFTPTKQWLEHVQKCSVRFNNGGSGSFISPNGLVLTNHHVAFGTLEKLSSREHDYASQGYLARTRDKELKAKDLELNVLMSIEDVTARVKGAAKPGMTAEQAFDARRGEISKIESESLEKTGLRSDVVTLYKGGVYNLYRYKRYTDVRLVFAPEAQIAFLGGDADNFAYPRYCLDMAIFRVYEDGKPVKIEHYLKWSDGGAKNGELIFVSGHPGRTERGNTVAELKYLRDKSYPYILQRLYRWEVMATVYSGHGIEPARVSKRFLMGVANSRKAYNGMLAGLLDPSLMKQKAADERKLKAAVAANPELKDVAKAWKMIADAEQVRAATLRDYYHFEYSRGFNSTLFQYARTIVRSAAEYAKPNAERLREYTDAGKRSLELKLFSRQPIYPEFEIVKLADSLTWLCDEYGVQNKLVQQILAGKSPRGRAAELIRGTKLRDVAFRKTLYEGGRKVVDASHDPLIQLARLVDPRARKVRKIIETKADEPRREGYDLLAKARFKLFGPTYYPDATFTLRLAVGVVKGYEQDGKRIPFETDFAGMYKHAKDHGNQYPFNLPPRWEQRKSRINLKTPFNFVSTVDIIGGNSGSPVINRKAELVGLIFDGNIQSLVWDIMYTDRQARAVAVHSDGIIEALRSMYDARELVNEIVGRRESR